MKNLLSDLQFEHWQAVLLSALPALLNLCLFIYVRISFPADKTSKVFSLLLLATALFQTEDTLVRMSSTMEAAASWSCIFAAGVLFLTPLGVHFCLLFTGKKKYADSFIVQFLLYTPAVLFLIFELLNKGEFKFLPSQFWGWVYTEDAGNILAIEGYWIGSLGMLMLFLLTQHAFRTSKNSSERKQAMIIAIGFAIPLLQGIFTEVILPVIGDYHSIPLSSAFQSFFSIGILIALKRYSLFNVTDFLKTPTILEAMNDILIILSPDKKILFINKQGEQTLNVNRFKKDSLRIEDFFVQEKSQNENFSEMVFQPALSGKKIDNYAAELITKSGEKISVLISATSYTVGAFQSQILLLIRDISDLIHTEQQLALREEQLKDKTEELNTFFRRTTHDMKGPVASIIGLTKLIKNSEEPGMIPACADRIEISAQRLNTILLDFIKVMEVKEKTPEISLIDFPKMTDDIIQSLKYSTGEDVVDFKVSVDTSIRFHCDESLLDSILYNLVANAVNYRKKYTEENPFVHIHVYTFGNGIMMKVSDNGIGIQKEIQGKIFNLFFRGSSDSEGTGLGLSILQNAITKLNGRVELESEINKGTTFIVYLPDLKPTGKTENTPRLLSAVF